MLRYIVMAVLLAFASAAFAATDTHPGDSKVKALLRDARQKIFRAEYDVALKMLESYLKTGQHAKAKPLLHFYVIDAIGRIHLRVHQDPDAAIKFFSSVADDPRLTASEQDIVHGWIGGAKEWKALGKMPKDIHDADPLFEIGKKYFDLGVKKQKFVLDTAGSADFSIAANYLVPFTVHYDKDPRIGDALYMMGEIRRRTWYDNEYWSENFYLIEVIRRFPKTELAQRAYKSLEDDVHFGYTGSGGDNTPQSWIDLLKDFKAQAELGKEPVAEPPKMN